MRRAGEGPQDHRLVVRIEQPIELDAARTSTFCQHGLGEVVFPHQRIELRAMTRLIARAGGVMLWPAKQRVCDFDLMPRDTSVNSKKAHWSTINNRRIAF